MRRSAAQVLVHEAPARVRDLERLGVRFDADRRGVLALGLEGGHSVRRVVHAGGSATGRRVVRQLSALVVDEAQITVLEGARATAAWMHDGRCAGVVLEDGRALHARATILATGGAAALWSRTTNPPGSLGIGMSIAHAAGAQLADLEFLQFHPTAVIGVAGREGFLVTEAIRGEGATLHGPDGERFVEELAPRDEVSRAIAARLHATGATAVGLDMRAVDPALFPNVVLGAAGGRAGSDARADPGRPRLALHDGRGRDRPARAQHRARPLRRRRDGLHRPARRQPAGLELVERMLRLRRPRRRRRPRRGACRGGRAGPARRAPLRWSAPPGRPRRRSGATPGSCARARASNACSRTPIRWPG